MKGLKNLVARIPEFPSKIMRIISIVFMVILGLTGGFMSYEMLVNDFEVEVEWNMFESVLIVPLYIVGLVIAICHIGKNHYSQETIIETTYSDGTKKREKSNDIIDFLLGSIIIPLAMHFIVEPLLWAAVIYYPLMGVIALVGVVLPYIFPLIVVAICVGVWFLGNRATFRYRSVVLIMITLILSVSFVLGGMLMMG